MRGSPPFDPRRATRFGLALVFAFALGAHPALGQTPAGDDAAPTEPPLPTYVETVSVTATASPAKLEDIAGTVGRIDRTELERQGARTSRDLLLFEPGVEVAGDPARLGLGGFVIRGIGGNRVQTRLDGVPTGEDFAFGPLAITRFSIDPEALQSVEVLRSAASSLYGSDALGGVVSLVTRNPNDFLRGERTAFGLTTGFDGRNEGALASLHGALGRDRWRASLAVEGLSADELDNQGETTSSTSARTAPNPADHTQLGGRAKLEMAPTERLELRLGLEAFDGRTETEVYSARTFQNLGPAFGPGVTFTIDTRNLDADDRRQRQRASLEALAQLASPLADTLFVRAFVATNQTEEEVDERVVTTRGGSFLGPLRVIDVRRLGLFEVEQDLLGLELQGKRGIVTAGGTHLVTYGLSFERDAFDMLRDRREFDAVTGAPTPPTVLVPTKYFPASEVDTLGAYVQGELDLLGGRLRVIPGLRYDRARLDPDEADPIFLAGNPGTPAPTRAEADALSPKLGLVADAGGGVSLFGQYSRGFRTPPYSSVNNGFTNAGSGYRTLPNPDLEPETSDNFELGARWGGSRGSASLTLFDNRYEDFIEQVALGVNPANGLLEYQFLNLTAVRIRGVELAGDRRIGSSWRLRGALAWTEGENRDTGLGLNSVSPPKAVLGLDWQPRSRAWNAGLAATHLADKRTADLDRSVVNQFATPDATLVDLFAGYRFNGSWSIQGTVSNLFDETWWNWGDVAGIAQTSAVVDRYSSPGRTVSVTLRFQH